MRTDVMALLEAAEKTADLSRKRLQWEISSIGALYNFSKCEQYSSQGLVAYRQIEAIQSECFFIREA
jgi:hypothetical protein